jgi:hypothetical protein
MYSIYESLESINGTSVIIEASDRVSEIINNIGRYFLHFQNNNDCLYGSVSHGIYAPNGSTACLYNKGVYVKDITALYSYAVSLENLNRDRDVISHNHVAQAVASIWKDVDKPEIIKSLIQASTLPYKERDKLVELYYYPATHQPDAWLAAFTELYGSNALLYTDWLAEREAVALGYTVVNCDYKIADILRSAGVKNDTAALDDDYEFNFVDHDQLEAEEAVTLDRLYALVNVLGINVPKDVRVFLNIRT